MEERKAAAVAAASGAAALVVPMGEETGEETVSVDAWPVPRELMFG